MSEKIAQHIEKLNAARARLEAVLDAVPENLWEQQIYSEGAQWTVRQLLIHLMISDAGQNRVMMSIAEGKDLIPPDYDLERFNKRSVEKQAEITPAQARAALKESRQTLLDWLNTLTDATLEMQGRHASMQIMSISQILDVVANHEVGHANDIEHLSRHQP